MLNVKKTLTKILEQLANIQSGYITSADVSSHAYLDHTVQFPKAFKNTPNVIVGLWSNSTGYGMGSLSVSALNVSKTGFTARVFNNDSTQRTPGVYWIARGGYNLSYVNRFALERGCAVC